MKHLVPLFFIAAISLVAMSFDYSQNSTPSPMVNDAANYLYLAESQETNPPKTVFKILNKHYSRAIKVKYSIYSSETKGAAYYTDTIQPREWEHVFTCGWTEGKRFKISIESANYVN